MQLTYHFSTTKELAIQFGITYDKARYQVNKMVEAGQAEKRTVDGKSYYRLFEKKLTVNDSYDLALTYTFNVTNKQDRDLAIHFAASYRTTRRNAQVAMSKFINSYRHEAMFYGMLLTK